MACHGQSPGDESAPPTILVEGRMPQLPMDNKTFASHFGQSYQRDDLVLNVLATSADGIACRILGANFLVTYRKEEAVSLVLLLWCLVVKVVEQLLMKAMYEICHTFIMFGCFGNFST